MPATRDDLMARFAELGIATETREHAPVFTVEEARALRGHIPGGHCKNLFLKDEKEAVWLIVCLEEARVNLKQAPARIGSKRLTFGKPDLLMELLGVEPGSVTPFGLVNAPPGTVRVAMDSALVHGHEWVHFHPLVNSMTTAIRPAGLLRFLEGLGHRVEVLDLAPPEG